MTMGLEKSRMKERPVEATAQNAARTRQRYDRIAPVYDRLEVVPERLAIRRWRKMLWDRVEGPQVLEIGVGTGKNIPFYTSDMQITAIDLSPKMLRRARLRADAERSSVELQEADAQDLPFGDESFDSVVGTFVFCSIPDPIAGLQEAARVLKPGGQLLLLEHVLSNHRGLREMMRLSNPIMVRLTGANFDRETAANVARADFQEIRVRHLWLDVVKLIEAYTSGEEDRGVDTG